MESSTTMVDWVKQRWYGTTILAMVFCLFLGMGTAMIIGRTQPGQFWIIFGGNEDPGDGQGDGQARQQLIAGGWTDAENSFQVTWKADISQGTVPETNEAMAAGKAALNKYCGNRRCILAGFSLGSMPALQLQAETGHAADDTYVFGAPQPSPCIWHYQYQDNPAVEPYIETFGKLNPDRVAPAGIHNYFDGRDPYNNMAPQCTGPGVFGLTLDGHRIITKAEADASRRWVGTDGVLEFEVVAPPPVSSGADPSPIWAGCEGGDWHNTPLSPGPQTNPDQFGIPGLPIPGGSPIPSQEGNMPAIPEIPAFPTP
jgi:hypothetical protein